MTLSGNAKESSAKPRSVWRNHISGSVLVMVFLAAGVALAEPSAADKETARSLMNEADKAYAAKDYKAANKAYVAAHAIMGVPTTGVEVAKTQEALGMLVEARDTLLDVARFPEKPNEPQAFVAARMRAKVLAPQIAARIPSLTIQVGGLSQGIVPELRIDQAPVASAAIGLARKVNPGDHVIVVRAPGYRETLKEVHVKESENAQVQLEMKRADEAAAPLASSSAAPLAPPATSASSRPWDVRVDSPPAKKTSPLVYGGFIAGGLGLGLGLVTGIMAMSNASSAKDSCEGNRCRPEAQSDIDSSKTMGTISTISFAVGVLGAGVGIYGLLNPPRADHARIGQRGNPVRYTPVVGLGSVGVRGEF